MIGTLFPRMSLNRNMLDVGIGMLKSAIEYKVTEAGGQYIRPLAELKIWYV